MSVTDELWKYADELWKCKYADGGYDDLRLKLKSISNRIDMAVRDEYIKLPEDADGVPVHVGDWITGKWGAKAKVEAVTPDDVYWWEPDGCHWCHAFEIRHYHEPTVEDVLREMCLEIDRRCERGGIDYDELFAEYSEKLREVVEHEQA